MSEPLLLVEQYLAQLAVTLRGSGRGRARVLAEARAHLTEAVDQRVASGAGVEEAQREAIGRFGTPGEVSDAFLESPRRRSARAGAGVAAAVLWRRRWLVVVVTLLGLGVGFVFAARESRGPYRATSLVVYSLPGGHRWSRPQLGSARSPAFTRYASSMHRLRAGQVDIMRETRVSPTPTGIGVIFAVTDANPALARITANGLARNYQIYLDLSPQVARLQKTLTRLRATPALAEPPEIPLITELLKVDRRMLVSGHDPRAATRTSTRIGPALSVTDLAPGILQITAVATLIGLVVGMLAAFTRPRPPSAGQPRHRPPLLDT